MSLKQLPLYAPILLRWAMAGVFLYFGVSQLTSPTIWTGLVPAWATGMSHLDAITIIHVNGMFEIVASLMLIIGLYVRWVALLLALHLFVIATSLGINPLGIRDFGLSLATLAIAFYGDDMWVLVKSQKE